MTETYFRQKLRTLLESAGITIDGSNPWDIRVLDEFFYRILRKGLDKKVSAMPRLLNSLVGKIVNLQHPARAFIVGETHYNIGNDLYRAMLGKQMIYSCGYWRNARNLDEAHEQKPRLGHKNYRACFQTVRNALAPDGLFLLHTIGSKRTGTNTDRWTSKYIFPNSMLPSANHITRASEGLLVMEDWHSFGHDYSLTLKAWNDNIERHLPTLARSYNERFFRMWRYYLLSAAGSFRARNVQLWQIVYSQNGIEGPFEVPRQSRIFA